VLWLARSRIANFHEMNFLNGRLGSLLLAECENAALVSSDIIDLNICEASSESFKDLHLFLLSVI
jgi:hypothetical protein